MSFKERKTTGRIMAIASALFISSSALADIRAPVAYDAVYDVFRNGKRIAEANISLSMPEQGQFIYTHQSKGIKGLARLLKAGEDQHARFEWHEGTLLPQQYESTTRIAGRKQHWSAHFDYRTNVASGENEDGPYSAPLEPQTHDPVTLQFALTGAIAHGAKEVTFNLLDEGEIEPRVLRIGSSEPVTTPLGCTMAVKAERVRENSLRYTESWYAPGLRYILVRLDHGKRGDDHNSLQLRSLRIEGRNIILETECN